MVCISNTIELTQEELKYAKEVAKRLHDKIRAKGGRDAHGLRGDTESVEIVGATCELAASKFLELPWSASEEGHNTNGPDIGKFTQVRGSDKPRSSHSLLVRPRDIEKYGVATPFVLVIKTGSSFCIKGWATANEVVTRGRIYDDNNRPSVWMLHESKLNPMDTFRDEIA